MKNRRTISGSIAGALGLMVVLAFAAKSASANELWVNVSGVWGVGTPTSAESASGAPWDISFDVSSPPTIPYGGSAWGIYFTPDITNAEYFLGGAPAPSVTISSVSFFNLDFDGGITVFFADGSNLNAAATQLYSGLESSPSIFTGIFPINQGLADWYINGFGFVDNFGAGFQEPITGNITIAPAPEPSSLLLLGSGILGLGGLIKRKLSA